jgi:acyl-CoA synthetase (AMP-forming)/AMP-acid ligase II
MAVTDFFDRGWRANPDGIAFIAGDKSFTYQEIGELSCRVTNALLGRDIAPGAK